MKSVYALSFHPVFISNFLSLVLVQIWDKILTDLDTAQNNRAAVICGIYFSKSFSRCSYQEILKSYVSLGASQWVIDMHAVFLTNRSMHVKVGNCLSDRREVTGGAVQGSVLGVMDHNAVIEGVDQNLLTECHKYVDDLTTTETIGPEADGYLAVVGGEEKPMFHAPDSEENLQSVMDYCEEKGLKVNEKKT